MDAVFRKWGSSHALQLNAASMKTAAIDIEQRVTIKAAKGRIVIEAAGTFEFKLDELVASMSPQNLQKNSCLWWSRRQRGAVMAKPYIPDSGDVVWLELDP